MKQKRKTSKTTLNKLQGKKKGRREERVSNQPNHYQSTHILPINPFVSSPPAEDRFSFFSTIIIPKQAHTSNSSPLPHPRILEPPAERKGEEDQVHWFPILILILLIIIIIKILLLLFFHFSTTGIFSSFLSSYNQNPVF